MKRPPRQSQSAFTLVELLITISIISLLLAILLPSLSSAREQARTTVCASNIRQITIANLAYSIDHNDHLCPGAKNFLTNLHRWHGSRPFVNQPFNPTSGPLVPYLSADKKIRNCPTFRRFSEFATNAFELGNGGYGYNNAFLGRQLKKITPTLYTVESDQSGVSLTRVHAPANTLLFADAAFAATQPIEYSFAEPRFHPEYPARTDPSIHFRHQNNANVAWSDGHVDRKPLTFTHSSGLYDGDTEKLRIGWFGRSDDNRFFDLD